MKARKRGRPFWAFDIANKGNHTIWDDSLHSATPDDVKAALQMIQHLHHLYIRFESSQVVIALRADPTTSELVKSLEHLLQVNIDAKLEPCKLPMMSPSQRRSVQCLAAAITVARQGASVDTLTTLDDKKREKQKEKRMANLYDWQDQGIHGRRTFNAWVPLLPGKHAIMEPLSDFSLWCALWTDVPLPLRNFIGRVHHEAFHAALIADDLELNLQRHAAGKGLVSNLHRKDGFAHQVVRYIAGWMVYKTMECTQTRKQRQGFPTGGRLARKDGNDLHTLECKLIARMFQVGQRL
jgi:hypothetical protein